MSNTERRLLNEEVENIQLPESNTLYNVPSIQKLYSKETSRITLLAQPHTWYFILRTWYNILDTYV